MGLGKWPVFLGQVTSQLRAYLPRISSIADSKSDNFSDFQDVFMVEISIAICQFSRYIWVFP